MKKWIGILLAIGFLLPFSACSPKASEETLPPTPNEESKEESEIVADEIYLKIKEHKITVQLERNAATEAFVERLKQGEITYSASDYGGFEKVGQLEQPLPRSDRQMTAEAGDVMLYLGDRIVLFYGSNAWSYTKLGRVTGVSAEEWKGILTSENPLTVTISYQ